MPGTITIKLSGSLVDPANVQTLAQAIARCPEDLQILLVHGGGPQLDAALTRLDEPVCHRQGLRVTTRGQAGIVQATLEHVGHQLAHALTREGCPAVHISSLHQRLVAKVKHLGDGTDLGRVGTPVRFDPPGLEAGGPVPVITPVGTDGTGPLNVNADEAAAEIAQATGSSHLILATGVPGVLDEHGHALDALAPAEAERLIEEGTASGGMQPKLEAALAALADGVDQVHIAPLSPDLVTSVLDGPTPGTRVAAEVPA